MKTSPSFNKYHFLTGAISLLGIGTHSADTITSVFSDTTGDRLWSTGTNWNPQTVPNNAGDDDFKVRFPAGIGRVTLDQIATVNSLEVGVGAELFLKEPSWRLFPLGPITNNGLISFSTTTGSQRLQTTFDGDLEFQGSGIVDLGNSGNLWGQNGMNTLINGPGHRIQGAGRFSLTSIDTVVNEGSFFANVPAEELWIELGVPYEIDLKGGDLGAENGGILVFANTTNLTASDNGTITVGDDSEVRVRGGSYEGVKIQANSHDGSLDDNLFRVSGNSVFRSAMNSTRIEATNPDFGSRTFISLQDTSFYNSGIITLSDPIPGGSAGGILISGKCSLEGPGRFVIDDAAEGIWSNTGDDHFIHGLGHTIEGTGTFGLGGGQIEKFWNHGSILANAGGIFNIRAGNSTNEFVNEPDGIIRAENNTTIMVPNSHTAPQADVVLVNRGLIEVKTGSVFDASGNPTLGNIRKDSIVQTEGEIRSDGEFEADLLHLTGGVLSGAGEFRLSAALLEENVTIRPGNPIGRLHFTDNLPTSTYPGCGGIFSVDLAGHSDVVQLGGTTLDLDIESPSSFDAVQFGEMPKMVNDNVYATGSVRLKLNMIGDPANFGPGVEIPIVTGTGFTTLFRVSSGGFLQNCGGSNVRVDNFEVGGLTVANLQAGDFITTYDGRATFKVVTDLHGITLTEPFFTPELPASNLTFETDTSFTRGNEVATVPVPAGITGTPKFGLVGDGPFDIDVETGRIFVKESMGLLTEATEFQVTVSVYDGDKVQVNPTTITVNPKPQLNLGLANDPGALRIDWNGGRLFESETLGGPWKEVVGAKSPFPINQSSTRKFWRIEGTE